MRRRPTDATTYLRQSAARKRRETVPGKSERESRMHPCPMFEYVTVLPPWFRDYHVWVHANLFSFPRADCPVKGTILLGALNITSSNDGQNLFVSCGEGFLLSDPALAVLNCRLLNTTDVNALCVQSKQRRGFCNVKFLSRKNI